MPRVRIAAALLAVLAVAACKREEPPIDGIGRWHIGRSLKSEAAVCRPLGDGISYCSPNPEMSVAGHRATVDLYFRGAGDSAPLSEILLALGPCDVEAVDSWLTTKLGPAPGRRGRAFVWPGKAATVAALLSASDGVCQIHFLEPSDEKRLGQLEKESLPAR